MPVLSRSCTGDLPRELLAFALTRPEIEVSAIEAAKDGFRLRVHESVGAEPQVRLARGSRWRAAGLTGLDGAPQDRLQPFQIGILRVKGARGRRA